MKNCLAVPLIERGLAAGSNTAIQGCQEYILTARDSLIAFWHMMVDDLHYLEFSGEIPQSRQSAKLEDIALEGFSAPFLKPSQEAFGGSKMHQHDGTGFAVYAPRFYDLPVSMPPGDFLLYGCHIISVYIWQKEVKKKISETFHEDP